MTKLNQLTFDILPYEKCIKYGPESLSNAELLAVLLRSGTKKHNCLEIAYSILKKCGNQGLLGLKHLNIHDLQKIQGIGQVRAIMLVCVGELSSRIAKTSLPSLQEFQSSSVIAEYYMEDMRHLEKEHFVVLLLNTKCRLLHKSVLSVGTINYTCVSTREIFKEALSYGAVYIILLHNHPSGDPTPSKDDIVTTKRIIEAGNLIGIPMLDHIIIGDHCYVSFKEKKLI